MIRLPLWVAPAGYTLVVACYLAWAARFGSLAVALPIAAPCLVLVGSQTLRYYRAARRRHRGREPTMP